MNFSSFSSLFSIVLVLTTSIVRSSDAHHNWRVASASANATTTTYFSVGPGGSDVIPHQIVRTNSDHLYIFANAQSSNLIRVYRTTGTGLPTNTSAFAAPIPLTESSNPISVDAVYDGGNIIHMLINTQNGHVKDYPFNTLTNTFNNSISLASNGGTVNSVLYIGTSGVAGMVDLNGTLHVVYWSNANHILHRAYSYNSSTNALTPLGDFVQVDTAGNANHPAVAISPVDNSLTVAWVSQADNPAKIRTRVRASNGTWGAIQSASTASVWTSADNGLNIDQGPSLIIDSSGTKHLAYIQSFDGSIGDYGRIHYVNDTGSGWVDQSLNALSHDPALALNSFGEVYLIGHGHPLNASCKSMDDMCIIKKNPNGTWQNPQLFAAHVGANSFDSSPSVKWSAVGFNRPDVIEFIFFLTPYDNPTLYYGRIEQTGSSPMYSISGNAGAPGVALSYTDNTLKTVFSQSDGSYSISIPEGWDGTVTPSLAGVTFTPANRSYNNVATNYTAQNYTAQVKISGNAGVAGATLSYVDGTSKTVTANGSGNYSITVPYGWTGTVTPSLNANPFCPSSQGYANLKTSRDGQNYAPAACPNFGSIDKWASSFDLSHGWTVQDYVRTVGDVNGDGRDDLVGFGQDGVYVALALNPGPGFGPIAPWTSSFDRSHGWTVKDYVRTVGDVNGDGRDDLVGFGLDGVYVATSTGSGFNAISRWTTSFDLSHGWTVSQYVRTVGDVNGDGRADLVGFGLDGVYVALALNPGPGFGSINKWTSAFDQSHGWNNQDHVRTVGDVNGDGRADLVGFGLDGVYVATSTGSGFNAISQWTGAFAQANGWTVKDYVRTVGDVNGDGKADIVGFGLDGVYIGLSTGSTFSLGSRRATSFDLSHGWTVSQYVRTVGDINSGGKADLVGFGLDGVYIATAQ